MKRFRAAGCTLVGLMVVMLAREAQAGVIFTVGGDYGWTTNIDYDKWVSNYKVKVGDGVQFDNHDSGYHTVDWVDKEKYDSCGDSGKKLTSAIIQGGSSLAAPQYAFDKSGDFYIMCDLPGHCVQGQKVHIQVLNADGTVSTTVNTTVAEPPVVKNGAPHMPGFGSTSQLMAVVVATFSLMVAAATM